MSIAEDKRFRVISADVSPFIAKLPVELPTIVKRLVRSSEWQPQHEGLITIEEAERKTSIWGCLGSVYDRNSGVLDIEEVVK